MSAALRRVYPFRNAMSTISTFALIFALLAAGVVLARSRLFPLGTGHVLVKVALYVLLPASILRYVPRLEISFELAGLVAVPWLICLAGLPIALLARRWLALDRGATACVLLGSTLGNTAYLGYALVPALLGVDALGYAVVFDQFGSFIGLATFGLFAIAWFSGSERPSLLATLRRLLLFPPAIALVVALLVMPAEPWPLLAALLDGLASALLPCVVIAVGMQLRFRLHREQVAPLLVVVVAKLVLMPALAWLLASMWGLSIEMRDVAVLQAGMPTMITTSALLALAGLAPELAAAMVGYTTVLSMLSLPLWHWLLSAASRSMG